MKFEMADKNSHKRCQQIRHRTKRRSWTHSFMHKKLCWAILISIFVVFTGSIQKSECFIAETITLALPTMGSYMSSTAVAGLAAAGVASAAAIGAALGKLALRAKPLLSALNRLAPLAQDITDEDIRKFQELLDSDALDQLQEIRPEEIEQLRNAVQSGQLDQLSRLTPEQIEQFISLSDIDIDPQALQGLSNVDPSTFQALSNIDPKVVQSLGSLEATEIDRLQTLGDVDPDIINSLGDLNPDLFKELSNLEPEVIQQLSELDSKSLKQLKGLSSAFGESGLDPSILSLLGGGEVGDASSGTDLDGDKPILVDPKVLRQLVASGQISQEVADTIVTKGTKSNTGINIKGIDPRIIKALKRNPGLLKKLQGPDGKIDTALIKQFTENGGELNDDQIKVLETGTLPPEIADVPANILRETGFFDGLPKAIQIMLGVLDPDDEIEVSGPNEEDRSNTRNGKLKKPVAQKLPKKTTSVDKPRKSRLSAIKLGIIKRVNRTRTLPPKLRKVPKAILQETGLFDTLPKDLQKELGLLNAQISKSSEEKETSPFFPKSKLRRRIDDQWYPVGRKPFVDQPTANILLQKLNPTRILQTAKNAARHTTNVVSNMLYSQYNRMRSLGIRGYSGLRRMFQPKNRRNGISSRLKFSHRKLPRPNQIVSRSQENYSKENNLSLEYGNTHRKWRVLRSVGKVAVKRKVNPPTSIMPHHHLKRRHVSKTYQNNEKSGKSNLGIVDKDASILNTPKSLSDSIIESDKDINDLGAISLEPIFKEIEYLDSEYDCGKLYVCELVLSEKELSSDEKVLLSLMTERHEISIASSKGPFDMAALLGRVTKSSEACRTRYSRCDIASSHYKNHPFLLM